MRNQSRLILLTALLIPLQSLHAADTKTVPFKETFDTGFDAKRFTTPIPSKNTEVRDGVLWTHGASGHKYPPMVYLPVKGKDMTISFRYRHLGQGGMLWFFVDGDDGFGSVDHMLRVKLLRSGVKLQVDSHSLNANHPLRQKKNRPADALSKAYRLNEFLPVEKVDLSASKWHQVTLTFKADVVTISLDTACPGSSWPSDPKHGRRGDSRDTAWQTCSFFVIW